MPRLQKKYCTERRRTSFRKRASRTEPARPECNETETCSSVRALSSCSAASEVIHRAFNGLSLTQETHTKAQRMDGIPSMMKVFCHPKLWMRYPVMIDIQSTVTGLPRIKMELARERSSRVNRSEERRVGKECRS